MDFPRRSARLNNNNQQRSVAPSFGQFSQPSSASSTSYPSPQNDSNQSAPPPPPRLQMQSASFSYSMPQHHNNHLHAPLPSPSASDLDPFFGRPHSQPNPYSSHPQQPGMQQMPSSQPQQQSYGQQNMQQQQQSSHPHHHTSFSQSGGMNHPSQPGALPQDFLAEAAKRAQMACLMRDLGDVSL